MARAVQSVQQLKHFLAKKIALPRLIGHRGAALHAPENTLSSMRKAKELGIKWVEFDVKETQDGVLIVMHDETLDRTTNGTGKVIEKKWSEISNLSAGIKFSSLYEHEQIPTFQEAIHTLKELNLGANIEIKPCPGREISTSISIVEFISREWPTSLPEPLISSFCLESLLICKQMQPQLILGALFEDIPWNWREILEKLKCSTFNVDETKLTERIVREIRNEGYPILAYTVNDKERAKRLFSWGVNSIFSDTCVEVD